MNKEEERTGAPALKRPGKLQQVEETPESCTMVYYSPETDKALHNISTATINKTLKAYHQLTLDEIGENTIYIENDEGQQLIVEQYNKLTDGLRESAKKLLVYMTGLFTYQNNKIQSGGANLVVKFHIEEYAKICGRDISTPDKRKEFGRALNYDIKSIDRLGFWFKHGKSEYSLHISQGGHITTGRGFYGIMFSIPYAEYLISRNLTTPIPNALFKIDNVNNEAAIAFQLGYYLCEHYNMDSNRENGQYDIISIKSILKRFSTYFNVAEAERNRNMQRIQANFEKAMYKLEECGIRWEYCKAKKAISEIPENFCQFERAYIHYNILNSPDGTERRKSNAARRKEATERKRKAISRSKNAKAKNGTTTENSAPAGGDQSGAQ